MLAALAAPVLGADKINLEKVKSAPPYHSAPGTEIQLKISNTILLSNISLKLLLLRLAAPVATAAPAAPVAPAALTALARDVRIESWIIGLPNCCG